MAYILDTDHVTLFQHGHPNIIQRARLIGSANIYVTIVTLEEQLQGRLAGIRKVATQPEKLEMAYNNLRTTFRYFCKVNLLDFNEQAYNYYRSFRQQKIRIGSQDLKIASIALANQMILVTRNSQDFNKIPDLSLEDWTI